jgi:hypothetical protein
MAGVKVKPLSERESRQKTDSLPPSKRQKTSIDKDGRDAPSNSQKIESPRKSKEKAAININAPLPKVPDDAYINRKAWNLFKDVTVLLFQSNFLIVEFG